MSSSRLGVGIIGAGQAAQALHIPALNSLADDFRIEACCDHDQGVAERVAASVGARAYTDPRALCADARVDVVLISAPDAVHMQMVEVACKAKKKAVVIEKPATLHARLAREMTRRAEATGVPVIVNYPHVYDYAFEAAQRAWGDRPLSYGQFRSVLGMNPLYTEDEILQTIRPQRPSWFLGVVNQMQYATATVELIGLEVPPHLYVGYILLIGVMIHDIPIMRRLVREPVSVEHASMRALTNPVDASGQCIDSILNVGRGRVLMQTELGPMRHTDWSFELRGDDLHVKVRFPNAFGGTSESECRLLRDAGGTTSEEIISGRYENGFRRMWLHARDVVRADVVVRTPLDDAVKDLEACEAVVKAAAENWRRGPASRQMSRDARARWPLRFPAPPGRQVAPRSRLDRLNPSAHGLMAPDTPTGVVTSELIGPRSARLFALPVRRASWTGERSGDGGRNREFWLASGSR